MRPTSPLPRLVISKLDHIPEREQALGAARLIRSATLIPALRSPLRRPLGRLALGTLLGGTVMTVAVLAGRLPLSRATPTIAAALLLVIVVALLPAERARRFGRKRPERDIWLATTTEGRVVGTAVVTSKSRDGVVTAVAARPQGQRTGTAIMRAVCLDADQAGRPLVLLASGRRVAAWYATLGFRDDPQRSRLARWALTRLALPPMRRTARTSQAPR